MEQGEQSCVNTRHFTFAQTSPPCGEGGNYATIFNHKRDSGHGKRDRNDPHQAEHDDRPMTPGNYRYPRGIYMNVGLEAWWVTK